MSLSPVLLLFATLALVSHAAAEGNDVDQRVEEVIDDNTEDAEATHPIYEFVYEVGQPKVSGGDGRGFGHKESRDGGRTWGTYFQQLSDGRLQTVRYWVDQSGYHAEVEYSGQPSTAGDWDDGGLAKRDRLVSRGQQPPQQRLNLQKARGGGEQTPLVQALLDSFPRESLQTKRSSTVGPEQAPAPKITEAPSRQSGGRATAGRQALRPIPVNEYALRWGNPRRTSGNRSNLKQTRRSQPSDENK